MEHAALIWKVVHDEETIYEGRVEELEIEPEKAGKIILPYKVEEILPETDYYLNLSLVYKEANQYAEAGMEIAHAQFKLPYHKSGKAEQERVTGTALEVIKDATRVTVQNDKIELVFDQVRGKLLTMRKKVNSGLQRDRR